MRHEDLPLKYRLLLAGYPWRRLEPVPRTRLTRPLSASRVALVTTAGLVAAGDAPFDLDRRGGDPTFRVIPHGARREALTVHHRSDAFDRRPLAVDLNVAFPVDRLDEAARGGGIGAAAPRHLSFMGSITAPGRLVRDHAPEAASRLMTDEVHAALLVPV